jgi:hypothetical protein
VCGVSILKMFGMNAIVISWGEPLWFAVFSWSKVSGICGFTEAPGSDLVEASRLVYEKRRAWVPLLLEEKRSSVVEEDLALYKVRCNLGIITFFGRAVLDVDMAIVEQQGELAGGQRTGIQFTSVFPPRH